MAVFLFPRTAFVFVETCCKVGATGFPSSPEEGGFLVAEAEGDGDNAPQGGMKYESEVKLLYKGEIAIQPSENMIPQSRPFSESKSSLDGCARKPGLIGVFSGMGSRRASLKRDFFRQKETFQACWGRLPGWSNALRTSEKQKVYQRVSEDE